MAETTTHKAAEANLIKPCPFVTEIDLSGRKLVSLHGLRALPNLQLLVASGNRLCSLAGLEHNTRLRELYADDNAIESLSSSSLGDDGDNAAAGGSGGGGNFGSSSSSKTGSSMAGTSTLSRLKHLTHLDLGNNALRDLEDVLASLRGLGQLRHLNLKVQVSWKRVSWRLPHIFHLQTQHLPSPYHVATMDNRATRAPRGRITGLRCSHACRGLKRSILGSWHPRSAPQQRPLLLLPIRCCALMTVAAAWRVWQQQ
jgi:hypothetical protein